MEQEAAIFPLKQQEALIELQTKQQDMANSKLANEVTTWELGEKQAKSVSDSVGAATDIFYDPRFDNEGND